MDYIESYTDNQAKGKRPDRYGKIIRKGVQIDKRNKNKQFE